MTGLGILYAKEATEEQDWAEVRDRDKPGRLRELYWARRGASVKLGRQPFLKMTARWDLDRTAIGRRGDEPGDAFVCLVSMAPRVEERFEWLEVTEVFTTVPASQIEGAMRAWNGIADKHPVDFDAFRRGLRRGRPSRLEQRCAADRVLAQIERKLSKNSYGELLERYGYGTLVVGMPLWFAVRPDDPFRAENAIDDFMTRTSLGLEELKRRVLRRPDCPFRKVVVVWETTPEAVSEWRARRRWEYGPRPLDVPPEVLEASAPSNIGLHVGTETVKKAPGKGPYPAIVEVVAETLRSSKGSRRPAGRWPAFGRRAAFDLRNVLRFVRVQGPVGLKRRIARKFSASHVRRRARRLYRESRRRGRDYGMPAESGSGSRTPPP